MKIAFYSPHMSVRGTEVALYDYAHYNEKILGNESIIISHENQWRNHESVIKKFEDRFNKIHWLPDQGYDFAAMSDIVVPLLDKVLLEEKCDAVYMQKGGKNDGVFSRVCRTFVLACSNHRDPHGDRYAYVSHWLSKVNSNGEVPVVPAMIDLYDTDEDLREELGIPQDAIVFGRTGGEDTWNIPSTSEVIKHIVENLGRDELYFVFQNTPEFHKHKNIINVPTTADMIFKTKFINTCDAMLHSRHEGESFGSTCGEFSTRNKPVIAWWGSPERSHIEILGDKGVYFDTPNSLFNLLLDFKKMPDEDWNCYRDYEPEKVMQKFNEVFIL